MNTLHPSTELPNTRQPWLPKPAVFPQITHTVLTDAAKALTQVTPGLHLNSARWLLRGHAVRNWVELGGNDLVGWSFTVNGLSFYGELSDADTLLTITVRP